MLTTGNIVQLIKTLLTLLTHITFYAHTDTIPKQNRIVKIVDLFGLQMLKFYYKYINNSLPECNSLRFTSPLQFRSTVLKMSNIHHEFVKSSLAYLIPSTVNGLILHLPSTTFINNYLLYIFMFAVRIREPVSTTLPHN